ncbi:glycosyltransferase [Alphaproteobacteria bacterium]|nr:glycosyltransferase [Alphaproteobacteria bacterium]
MKIAVIHDWLENFSGAEQVLVKMCNELEKRGDITIYTLVDYMDNQTKADQGLNWPVKVSFLQNLLFSKYLFRLFLPIMPVAIETFNLKEYDLVVSSSHAVAKNVLTHPYQKNICMCYTPMRYVWDLRLDYVRPFTKFNPLKLIYFNLIKNLSIWDGLSSNRVDKFIAISEFINARIKKYYRRDSTVIYPPCEIQNFTPDENILNNYGLVKNEYFVVVSRLIKYKKIDLLVDLFNQNGKVLVVIGDGPLRKKLQKKSNNNIIFLGKVQNNVKNNIVKNAKAFTFFAIEDFGIAPIEAQLLGIPVIGFNRGSLSETIVHLKTGLLVNSLDKSIINKYILELDNYKEITKEECIKNGMRFSLKEFKDRFNKICDETLK